MFNVVGKHLVQEEEGGEWMAEETRGGWALPQKVEHPQLKFLVAPLALRDFRMMRIGLQFFKRKFRNFI